MHPKTPLKPCQGPIPGTPCPRSAKVRDHKRVMRCEACSREAHRAVARASWHRHTGKWRTQPVELHLEKRPKLRSLLRLAAEAGLVPKAA